MARKILLADDSVTAQNMGRKILADAGYEVITVNNGSAALKKIGEQRPDLIVLDVYMPGYSGLEVCQRLKETGETSRIPVLLTVGKLEPFKPEEAKRVRADAYIVKPFEASELLSALSKLEDKVVPRSESSKPGRFARATAAIEEGRYDKTMAAEEDSSWKNRISFPTKKKEKPAEKEIDTGEIYNPVNKDLRTVVDPKNGGPVTADASAASVAEEAHVNLGALAPEGLPKDVTPEEIAALAAAAAQIKGSVTDVPAAQAGVTVPPAQEIQKAQGSEEKKASEEQVHPVAPVSVPEVAATAPAATFAGQEAKEKTEEKKELPAIVSTQSDAMNAIMGLETQVMAAYDPESGNASWGRRKSDRREEPITMAVAAVATDAAAPAASRWSAMAVALAPEEVSLSLEQEMQKAYAEFAAAESGHGATAVSVSEAPAAVPETSSAQMSSAVTETPETQSEAPIPASVAPEVVQPLSAVSEAATEAMSAAVKELEAVAAKFEAEHVPVSPEPVSDKSLKAAALESPTSAVSEAPVNAEAKNEDRVEPQVEGTIETKPEDQPVRTPEVTTHEIASAVTTVFAVPAIEREVAVAETQIAAMPQPQETERAPETVQLAESNDSDSNRVTKAEAAEEKSSTENIPTDPVPLSNASKAGRTDDMAKRESDTAAAWASWRKIRETGAKPAGESSEKDSRDETQDRAAKAVAAGAEGSPEEVAALDSDPEIASLVDSVLADMRPKIVEEIAKKLGKKK